MCVSHLPVQDKLRTAVVASLPLLLDDLSNFKMEAMLGDEELLELESETEKLLTSLKDLEEQQAELDNTLTGAELGPASRYVTTAVCTCIGMDGGTL